MTKKRFKTMNEPDLGGCIAWPLVITGCLSLLFGALIAFSGGSGEALGLVLVAAGIGLVCLGNFLGDLLDDFIDKHLYY